MFEIAPIDNTLVSNRALVKLFIDSATPISGFEDGQEVFFQFPPKITSDNKSANWKNIPVPLAYEPIVMWEGNDTRKISIKWEYVVTNSTTNGKTWNINTISKMSRTIKSYFYTGGLVPNLLPVFKLALYNNVPTLNSQESTWRGMNISIKPGKSIIVENNQACSIKTEFDLSLEMITNINKPTGSTHYAFNNVPPQPLQQWY